MASQGPCFDAIKAQFGDLLSDDDIRDIVKRVRGRTELSPESALAKTETQIEQAAKDAKNAINIERIMQKRNALINIKAVNSMLDQTFKPVYGTLGEGFRAFFNGSPRDGINTRLGVGPYIDSVRAKRFGTAMVELQKTDPTVFKVLHSGEKDKDILRAIWAIKHKSADPVKDALAHKIARVMVQVNDEARTRKNMAGAFIHDREDFMFSQYWDREKMHKVSEVRVGRKGHQDSAREIWVRDMISILDQDKTMEGRGGGQEEYRKFLDAAFEGLYTGIHDKVDANINDSFSHIGSLSKKLSQRRVLHFKGPDEFAFAMEKYGHGSVFETFLASLNGDSHNIGMLEMMGTNPEHNFNLAKRRALEMLKESTDIRLRDNVRKQENSINGSFLDKSFKAVSGALDSAANPTLGRIGANIRAWIVMSRIEKLLISQLPDPAFWKQAANAQGIKNIDAVRTMAMALKPSTPEGRQRMMLAGIGLDSFSGALYTRFVGPDMPTGMILKMNQAMFKVGGSNLWNDAWKRAFGDMTAANFGIHSHLPFAELNGKLKANMSRFGITDIEWELMRGQAQDIPTRDTPNLVGYDFDNPPAQLEGHVKMLLSDNFRDIPREKLDAALVKRGSPTTRNNRYRLRNEVQSKYDAYMVNMVNDAVLTPGNLEKVISTWGTQRGTFEGEAVRLLMLFKTFPIMINSKVLRRAFLSNGNNGFFNFIKNDHQGKLQMFELMATSTILGYASLVIKDALIGRTPRRIVEENGDINGDVIAQAMLRGGAMGAYGDLFVTEYDKRYNRIVDTIAGPAFGQVDPILSIASQGVKEAFGEETNIARDATRFARDNMPWYDLWFVRPAMDYLFYYKLTEALNPGALSRMEKGVEEKNHQSFYLSPKNSVAGQQIKKAVGIQ